MHSLSRKSK
jgi:hypothetical protein